MALQADDYTNHHLQAWLEREIAAGMRKRIGELMSEMYNDDPEYWTNQTWHKLMDAAVSQEVYNQIKADAELQADVDAMAGDV